MSTAHWVQAGQDTVWNVNTAVTPSQVVIPAGATMKRFTLTEVSVNGVHTANAYNGVSPLRLTYSIDIVAGQYAPRRLFSTSRRVPVDFAAFTGGIPVVQAYFAWVSGGDNELGCDQAVSYGTAAGPGFTVKITLGVFGANGTLTAMTGGIKYNLRALYLTTP